MYSYNRIVLPPVSDILLDHVIQSGVFLIAGTSFGGELKIENLLFSEDLLDPESQEFKAYSTLICDEV